MNSAILLNLSGHRVPTQVFSRLERKGYESFTIYPGMVDINVDRDMGVQVKEIIHALLTKRNSKGMTATECDGTLFLLLPAHSTAAVLIYQALEKLMGYPVPLLITGKDHDPERPKYAVRHKMIGDPFDVKGFAGQWRGERSRYLFNKVREVPASTPTAPVVRKDRRVSQRKGDSKRRRYASVN